MIRSDVGRVINFSALPISLRIRQINISINIFIIYAVISSLNIQGSLSHLSTNIQIEIICMCNSELFPPNGVLLQPLRTFDSSNVLKINGIFDDISLPLIILAFIVHDELKNE